MRNSRRTIYFWSNGLRREHAPSPGNACGDLHEGEWMNVSWQTEISIYRFGVKNVYGEAQLQFVRKTNVGVVKFEQSNEKSSVRADSSGSRGKANLELFDAVLVIPLEAAVQLDDVLILEGQKLKVSSVHRRWGLRGRPGHLEVGANIWV